MCHTTLGPVHITEDIAPITYIKEFASILPQLPCLTSESTSCPGTFVVSTVDPVKACTDS